MSDFPCLDVDTCLWERSSVNVGCDGNHPLLAAQRVITRGSEAAEAVYEAHEETTERRETVLIIEYYSTRYPCTPHPFVAAHTDAFHAFPSSAA